MSKGSKPRPCADEAHRRAEHERIFSTNPNRSVEAWKELRRKSEMGARNDK